MNLKLKQAKSSKYMRRTIFSLEKQIDEFNAENEGPDNAVTRNQIIAKANKILSILTFDVSPFEYSRRQIRLLEKLNAKILGNGGLRNIDPQLLSEYLNYMNKFFYLNDWRKPEENELDKTVALTYRKVLQEELKQFEGQPNSTMDEDPNIKECFMQILDYYVHYHIDLSELEKVLSKHFDIDLSTGKNIDQIPEQIITKSLFNLVKLHYDYNTNDKQQFVELSNQYFEMVYNYAQDVVQKESPERVLLRMPELMEFYNIACSTITTEYGDIVPDADIMNKSIEILDLLNSNISISEDEEIFMERASEKYMSRKMPDYVLKKYIEIYLKMLTDKFTNPCIEQNYTAKAADVLLGQYALGNPVLFDKNNSTMYSLKLLRLLAYDYAKIIAKEYAPFHDLRITRSRAFDYPGCAGCYSAAQKTMELNVKLNDLNEVYNLISAIFHESMHATEYHSRKFNEYNSPVEYSANKLWTLWTYHNYFVINYKLNYYEGAHEILSRIEENKGLQEFMERHGCDKLYPDYYISIKENKKFELNRSKKHDSIHNPYFFGKAKEAKKDGLVSFKDGFNISISDVFDRFICSHLELCQPGSYYSIEYNPNGKRKTANQILNDLGNLDESQENDKKRQIYKYIIQNGCLRNEDPNEVLKALSDYKSTNPKNDEIVQTIVQESIFKIIKRIENKHYRNSVLDLRKKYLETGADTSVYFVPEGNSYLEKTSVVIDRIVARYDKEKNQSKTEGDKAISPFVKGLMAPAKIEKKHNISFEFGSVMGALKRYQASFKLCNPLAVTKETMGAYCISVGDIFKMIYGPIIGEKMQIIREQMKSIDGELII